MKANLVLRLIWVRLIDRYDRLDTVTLYMPGVPAKTVPIIKNKKLRGPSPLTDYTDRTTADCWRS
jgi:hypothetical protein